MKYFHMMNTIYLRAMTVSPISMISYSQKYKELYRLTELLNQRELKPDSRQASYDLIEKINLKINEMWPIEPCSAYRTELQAIQFNLAIRQINLMLQMKRDPKGDKKLSDDLQDNIDVSQIHRRVNQIFIAFSKGNLKRLPTALQLTIFSHLSSRDLATLMGVSHGCRSIASVDEVWRGQARALGLNADEISKGPGFKRAIKNAHQAFYTALYQDLSRNYKDYMRSEREVQQRGESIKKLIAEADSVEKMKRCFQVGAKYFAKFSWLQLREPDLVYLPGWLWRYFPNVKKLFLNIKRIRSLPLEIAHITVIQDFDCLDAPSLVPRPLERSSGIRVRFLEDDYKTFVNDPEHFEDMAV